MEESNNPETLSNFPLPEIIANSLRVEGIIGRGGMGTVYRATHLSLDRTVAVKIINPEFVANADINQRFTREARLMAKLRHPRAAVIYDSGSLPDGRLFIVMEYVEGETLSEVLKKEGRLPFRRAVEIATSICEVLDEAHSLGIIHRDLKPANIMLNERGIFVLDFGIAKMLHTDNRESLNLSMTGTGFLVGTPYYMSPEQCLGEKVGAQSDLYSLGALLYEMIAGRPPFNDDILSALIIKHATAEPPPIEQFSPDVPPALSVIIKRLLAKKPEDRPASAAETRDLLQASLEGQTAPLKNYATQINQSPDADVTRHLNAVNTSAAPTPLAASVSPSNKNSFRNISIVVGAVLLAAIVAIGGFLFMKSRSNAAAAVASNNQTQAANSNTAANYSDNAAGMNHDMGNMAMGNDFAEDVKSSDEKGGASSVPLISQEEADKVITHITQTTEHRADGMQIIKTPKDSAIVCIHNMIEMGKTHMFAVERPNVNSPWEITARISLDVPEFHGSNWTFEPQDVDGDGYEEVIFNGTNADGSARRILIYSPRTRQNYWITATKNASGKITGTTLSPNAQTPNSKAFRAALEQNVQSR
ncbi:MAG: serine/threonine protein kinase [Pyrinomonadaceae bacterium]